MKIENQFSFKLPCWFPLSDHEWTEWDHRPCHKFRTCLKCKEEERKEGWHHFGNWGTPFSVEVFDSNGRTVDQERQKRTCSDCQMIDVRVVGY